MDNNIKNWTEDIKPGDKVIVSIGNLFPWNYVETVGDVTDKHIVIGVNKFRKVGCMAEGNAQMHLLQATPSLLKEVEEEMIIRKAKDLISKVTTKMTFENAVKIVKLLEEMKI